MRKMGRLLRGFLFFWSNTVLPFSDKHPSCPDFLGTEGCLSDTKIATFFIESSSRQRRIKQLYSLKFEEKNPPFLNAIDCAIRAPVYHAEYPPFLFPCAIPIIIGMMPTPLSFTHVQ